MQILVQDPKIEYLFKRYDERKEEIKERLNHFSLVKEEDYFYELAFCILTPQSSARNAEKCINKLMELDFKNNNFNPSPYLNFVRFNINKGKYLMEMKLNFDNIINAIKTVKDSKELREWLVRNVKGISYKESGHFLRNIGYRNLAILDRHILKNLFNFNAINEVPKTLNKNKYFEIEEKFKQFSEMIGIDLDELDLLFWSMETGEIFK